jgi:hypothetical protein
MNILLRDAVKKKKQYLIDQLISLGIYKKGNKHLFEWSLCELEEEYRSLNKLKSSN